MKTDKTINQSIADNAAVSTRDLLALPFPALLAVWQEVGEQIVLANPHLRLDQLFSGNETLLQKLNDEHVWMTVGDLKNGD